MIGYYIHHHGLGHLSRATSICAQLHLPVTALTSLNVPDPHPFAAVLKLPRDDEGTLVADPTAHGAFHWAPHHDTGLMDRMRLIAQWVAATRPAAVVIDVSVEVATYIRLLGVPVIVVGARRAHRRAAPARLPVGRSHRRRGHANCTSRPGCGPTPTRLATSVASAGSTAGNPRAARKRF